MEKQTADFIPIEELVKKTIDVYQEKFSKLMAIAVIPFIFSFVAKTVLIFFGIYKFVVALQSFLQSVSIVNFSFGTMFELIRPVLPYLAIFWSLGITIGLLAEIAVIYCLKEKDLKTKEALKKATKDLFPALWISFLMGMVIAFGFFLFFLPAFIFYAWFLFSVIVLVFEGLKGSKALARSRELVKGRFWPVVLRIIAFFLIYLAVNWFFNFFAKKLHFSLLNTIGSILLMPLPLVYNFLLYQDLKRIKKEA